MYYPKNLILSSCVSPIHKVWCLSQVSDMNFENLNTVNFCFIKLHMYWILSKRMLLCSIFVDYKYSSRITWKILRALSSKPSVWSIGTAAEMWVINLVDVSENILVFRTCYAHPMNLFLLPFHSRRRTLILMPDYGMSPPSQQSARNY